MSESKVFKVCPTTEKALPEEPTGIIKAISDGSCKTGCGSMTRCICAYAEDMVDYAGKLRAHAAALQVERDAMREWEQMVAVALGVPGCNAAEMLNVIDGLREAAERYQYIRQAQLCGHVPICGGWLSEEHFDAAIDAARKETP